MSKSSEYWKLQQQVKHLQKEKESRQRDIEALRQRDVLKAEIGRQKKEKFYRSSTGKALLSTQTAIKSTASAFKGISQQAGKEWSSPKAKKERKSLGKDLMKFYNQIAG